MPRLVLNIPMKDIQDEVNRIIRKKVKSVYYEECRNEIAGLYKDAVEHYVPLKSGNLRENVKIKDGTIIYSAKAKRPKGNFFYAQYQYDNEFSNRTTPGTYGHWNTHLTIAEWKALGEEIAKIIIERMNNG